MILEDGKTYVDGWGHRRKVMGSCPDYPEWVWTLQGFWYERSTGKQINYGLVGGTYQHYVLESETWALQREVTS